MTSDSTPYDRTVNAVDDLGWSPEGNRPVTDSLQSILQDGTLVELPPGEYLVDGRVDATGLENWGIRGTGDTKGDARFIVPPGKAQRIFNIRGDSRNILIENLTFDQYDTWETCIGNVLQVADGLVVRDVEYAGKNPSEKTGATSHLNLYVLDPDGSALLDGLVVKGATELIDYPENVLTIFSGKESKGTITILNSHFENCGEHAIYASRCESAVRIEGCYFKNNQNTHARISGEGSWVKNSTFVWDVADHPNRGAFQAQTGMTFEAGFQGFSGGLVEGCDFVCKTSAANSGCLKVDGSHGAVTVRDCTFQVDADDAEPIWVDAPGDSHMIDEGNANDGKPFKPWDILLDGVTITGSGGWESKKWHDVQHSAAVRIDGRSGSVLRGSIVMSNRDGVRLVGGDYQLDGMLIDVGGTAVLTENATVTRTDGNQEETDMTSYENVVTIIAPSDGVVEYEIDVDGAADLKTDGDYAATPPKEEGAAGETVTEHDGTRTLAGICARGGGDSFHFDGGVVDVRIVNGPDPVVEVNGTELDLSQFRESGGGSGSEGLTDIQREEVASIVAELDTDTTRADEEIRAIVAEEMPTKAEIVAAVREALEQQEAADGS